MTADVLETAMTLPPEPSVKRYYGEMQVDPMRFPDGAVFQAGAGMVPFDEAVHQPDQKHPALSYVFYPLKGNAWREQLINLDFGDWPKVLRPSLEKLGEDLRNWPTVQGCALRTRWVCLEVTNTGKQNKKGYDIRETRIIAVFDSQEACQAASDAFFNRGEDSSEYAAPSPAPSPAPNAAKATAEGFLRPFWASCGGDKAKFYNMIRNTPVVAEWFNEQSPEVQAIVAG